VLRGVVGRRGDGEVGCEGGELAFLGGRGRGGGVCGWEEGGVGVVVIGGGGGVGNERAFHGRGWQTATTRSIALSQVHVCCINGVEPSTSNND